MLLLQPIFCNQFCVERDMLSWLDVSFYVEPYAVIYIFIQYLGYMQHILCKKRHLRGESVPFYAGWSDVSFYAGWLDVSLRARCRNRPRRLSLVRTRRQNGRVFSNAARMPSTDSQYCTTSLSGTGLPENAA